MKLYTFSDTEEFINEVVEKIVQVCQKDKEVINIALSGGLTPRPIYEAWAKRNDVPWEKIHLWQVDERCVPFTDENSNYRMISQAFGRRMGIARLFFFDTSYTPKKTLHYYEKNLLRQVPEGFDLSILGIGTDGHTASLFPYSRALHETNSLVVHTQTEEFAVKDRLTLTFRGLLGSKSLFLLAQGEGKESILKELQSGTKSDETIPAKKLLEHESLEVFYDE